LSQGVTVDENSKDEIFDRLQSGKKDWEKREPSHYKYIVLASGYFVWHISDGPNEVEVKDGDVVKVTYRGKSRAKYPNGYVLPKEDWEDFSFESYFSKAELFLNTQTDLVGDGWSDERFWFVIDFDANSHHPNFIARNDPTDYHGEYVVRIGYFEAIE